MLVDANVLIHAVDADSPHHAAARAWLDAALAGDRRVGLPWQSIAAFLRITTDPRISAAPLSVADAWSYVSHWLELATTWAPEPGPGYGAVLGRILATTGATGKLMPDAMVAALAIEHGVPVVSGDSDFARFADLTWINPFQ